MIEYLHAGAGVPVQSSSSPTPAPFVSDKTGLGADSLSPVTKPMTSPPGILVKHLPRDKGKCGFSPQTLCWLGSGSLSLATSV